MLRSENARLNLWRIFLGRTISALIFLLTLSGLPLAAQVISFTPSGLAGNSSVNPTSLQFGPDGRLYVAQQDGKIMAYNIVRNAANDYSVVGTEVIELVHLIPNHDDNGDPAPAVLGRQVTGMFLTGTIANPVIYVTSSDPRNGAGSGGVDIGLDTNSGMISRLTWNGSSWEKLDIVRGLPRSEEKHSLNGLRLDPSGTILYVNAGGNTNMGAPSNNFAELPEYAYSNSILEIDLTAIGESTYDLPTLDDEDRPGIIDSNDPFGGNDGKNQAMLEVDGPVQIYSSGWRNNYDILITASGKMYSSDNGPNSGWGGMPVSCSNAPSEGGVTYKDNLHYVPGPGFYAGHPNPTRANRNNTFNLTNPQTPIPLGMEDASCAYLQPGVADGAITIFDASTNGLDEYRATNFGGIMVGNILAASFNGSIYRVVLNAAGDALAPGGKSVLASSFGAQPLDLTCQGDDGPFPGTIWVATYGTNAVTVFEPNDFVFCDGDSLSFVLDDDGDGYSNGDETTAGSDRCNPAVKPNDADNDFLSDFNDDDDDNDGIPDTSDPFSVDFNNGATTFMPVSYKFDNSLDGGLLNIGFTGLMTNGGTDYLELFDPGQMTAGGAGLKLTIDDVSEGDAFKNNNTQEYGFQFGVNTGSLSGQFEIHTRMYNPFSGATPTDFQSMGFFFGNGDQDNYFKLVLIANGGVGGVQWLKEVAQATTDAEVFAPILGSGFVDLYLTVDAGVSTVQSAYSIDGGAKIEIGTPVAFPSEWLNESTAVGIISTSFGPAPEFSATWDLIEVIPIESTASASFSIDPGNDADSGTENPGSFSISNNSPDGQRIQQVIIDLSSALLPDLVFDINGTTGDDAFKQFTIDSDPGTVYSAHNYSVLQSAGFRKLTVNFSNFDPGDSFSFSADIDPTSIQGSTAPGPEQSSRISGIELAGAAITVEFDDGFIHVFHPFPDGVGSNSSSNLILQNAPTPPSIEVVDVGNISAVVPNEEQVVRVSGSPGTNVKLLMAEAGLYTEGVPGGGFDLDPFEANKIISSVVLDATIAASGTVDIPVSLTSTDTSAGLNYLAAVSVEPNGRTSLLSNKIVLRLDTTATASPLIRINSGGFPITAAGLDWDEDSGNMASPFVNAEETNDKTFNTNTLVSLTHPSIPDGTPMEMFQSERWDEAGGATLQYDIPVPIGTPIELRLYFAEIFNGITAAGQRVFNVEVEGSPALVNYDVFAEAGGKYIGIMESFSLISDGNIDIDFQHVINNPAIKGIEIIQTDEVMDMALLLPSPSFVHFFTQAVETTSLPETLTLTNGGNMPLTISEISISGANASEFDADFTLPATILPGEQYEVDITFSPIAVGLRVATLNIIHDGVNSPLTVELTGEADMPPAPYSVFINSAGPAYISVADDEFIADAFFSGGSVSTRVREIANTDDDILFHKERYGTFEYNIPVVNTTYTVSLYFTETWSGANESGERVFNVDVEGNTVLNDYDIVADVGFETASIKIFEGISVTDGFLNISLYSGPGGVENPKINAIAIVPVEDTSMVNIAPIAANDNATLLEGGTEIIEVWSNDTDPDGTIINNTVSVTSNPAHGTVSVDPVSGSVTYIHNGSNTVADQFGYSIQDNDGAASNQALVFLTITPVNAAPIAIEDIETVSEGNSVLIAVLDNDTDPDGMLNNASLLIEGLPTNGTASVDPVNGTILYTHNGSNTVSDSFTYSVQDNEGAVSNTATVNITIAPFNQAPIAGNDAASVNQADFVSINIIDNDSDPDGTLNLDSIEIITDPLNGFLVIDNDFGIILYIHDGTPSASDVFTYTIQDNEGAVSNIATVNINVLGINLPPMANNDNAEVMEGGIVSIDILANDSDPDGSLNPASVSIATTALHGTLSVNITSGEVTYQHDGSNTISDSFSYTVQDNDGAISSPANVSISITPINESPLANDDMATVAEGGNTVVPVLANDSDPDGSLIPATVNIVVNAAHGTLSMNPIDGSVLYIHDGSNTISDMFTYTVEDNEGAVSDQATVAITITGMNTAPAAINDFAEVDEGGVVIIDILTNDFDTDGSLDPATVSIVAGTTHGTVSVNPLNGEVTYTHNGSNTVFDQFMYAVDDNEGLSSNITTVTIQINPINEAPVALDDEAEVVSGGMVMIGVTENDFDPDGSLNLASTTLVSLPSHGTLEYDPFNGIYTYTHDGGVSLSDEFIYKVLDDQDAFSNDATVTITIIPANAAPVAIDDEAGVAQGDSIVIDVLVNDFDTDGSIDPSAVLIASNPLHGSLSVNPLNGAITYYHNGSDNPTDQFSYSVRDDEGSLSNIAFVTITVAIDNLAPIASIMAMPLSGVAPLSVFFSAADSYDPDGEIVTYSWNMGDGTMLFGETVNHLYTEPGNYEVMFGAIDEDGAFGLASLTVTVQPAVSGNGTILLVVGSTALVDGDLPIKERLESQGYTVVVVDDDVCTTADALGKDLVIVSSTVKSSKVGNKYTDVSVPVLTWEGWIYDDLKMTANSLGIDYGNADQQEDILITNEAHPMAAGLSGTFPVVGSGKLLNWGLPNSNAVVVGVIPDDPAKALLFGYETGASMFGIPAPARRVGIFLNNKVATSLTPQGLALFDAAVCWAIGCDGVVVCDNITDGGSIAGTQNGCAPTFDPTAISNITSADGGSGALIYNWYRSFTGSAWSAGSPEWTLIPGADAAGYDPGVLSQTTYFVRVARRAGCEDYTGLSNIAMITVEACTVECAEPENFSLIAIDETSAGLTWTASENALSYELRVRPVSSASWTTYSTEGTIYLLSSLESCTSYEAELRAVCSETEYSEYTATLAFTTDGCGDICDFYCPSSGNSANEWIQNVQIGSFNQTSGNNGGYMDFGSSNTLQLGAGDLYTILLVPGFSSTSYPEYWRIWVDLNQDGDYYDPGEMVFDAGSTSTEPVFSEMQIPPTATYGTTGMRIQMKWNIPPLPCENFSFGEVQDYCIEIVPGSGGPTECGIPTNPHTVNVGTTIATIVWDNMPDAEKYKIKYRPVGTNTWIYANIIENFKYVNGLQCGTQYEYRLMSKCPDSWTDWSEAFMFTTLDCSLPKTDEELSGNAELRVYPNPASSFIVLNYESPVSGDISISLYDAMGRLMIREEQVASLGINEFRFSLDGFAGGFYFAEISDRSGRSINKFTVNH